MPPILAAPLRPRGRRLLLRPQLPRLLLFRSIHSPTPTTLDLDITHPTYMIWGANTGVGKTLVSAGLAASVLSPLSATPSSFLYLKPVQTGFPRDSDARFVYRKVSDLFRRGRDTGTSSLLASNHALTASAPAALKVLGAGIEQVDDEGSKRGLCSYEEMKIGGGPGEFKLVCKTLYGWNEAISPHLAAEREAMVVDDSLLRDVLGRCLALGGRGSEVNRRSWSVIETAGGVASPGPSGTLQCDLYRADTRSVLKNSRTECSIELGQDPCKSNVKLSRLPAFCVNIRNADGYNICH